MALICLICPPLAVQAASAPSITVNPGYTNIGVNQTVQYTATVSGLADTTVKWEVNEIAGGNSTLGTISSTGLYKAPAIVPTVSTLIVELGSDGKTMGVQYVNVELAGPSIASIKPNPIPTGNYTITLNGASFKPGAVVRKGNDNLSTTYVSATKLLASGYQSGTQSAVFEVENPGTLWGPGLTVPFKSSTGTPQQISPASANVDLGQAQQFTSAGATAFSATAGVITSAGLYTAPASLPASATVTVTATGPNGKATAAITLLPPTPAITTVSNSGKLALGIFSATVTGTGFIANSVASLNGNALATTYAAGELTITGFAGQPGVGSLTVSNGAVTSAAFPVQIGIPNPQVSLAAARRFLEQAAFGPTPTDAATVQSIGYQAWINQQFNMPQVSNYKTITSDQGGMPTHFLTNAVTNPDQLRQRVGFALNQIFVTSIDKLIWNGNIILYQNMLLNDSFTNYRQIMGDVTLSPAMGQYLDMANNTMADPAQGSVANENYARELMQLFTIGTNMLNQDGTTQIGSDNLPIPTYSQFTITEFARVYTGWTYAPAAGQPVEWGAYISSNGPLASYAPEHDSGAKHLLNGYVPPAGIAPQQDLNNALDNVFNHPNVGPFVATQLIQHLVKSNPSPAYVSRVATAFNNNGSGVRGDMTATISAILLDPEARANDNGGDDQPTDGHLQEPGLFIAAMVRAFGGQMNDQNYYSSELANMEEDIFTPPSVFNYYSPNYGVPGTPLMGGEFELHTPNNAIVRANEISSLFSQYSNPVQTYGPGTTVDLTAYLPLAANP